MCWSGATGHCTTKGAPQNNKTSIKFTARGQKAPGGVFMVEYGGGGLLQRHNLYGSPRGRSFYSCASSRALLHVGSLSLWDRQPSNAPPLLLSPAGLVSRRGPHTKTHLGLRPKPPLPQIRSQGACGAFYARFSRNQIKNQPYKRRLAPDPGGRRPSGRGKWGPHKVVRPCGERRMHCSGEGCPKQSIGSARLKRRLRPTSVGFLGRSPK